MVKLTAETPAAGLCPVENGRCRLEERIPRGIFWLAPFSDEARMPEPGRVETHGSDRWVWFGPGQALVLGSRVTDAKASAVADQSDGWAVFLLSGDDARDVLARLTPQDVRPAVFGVGQTARTLIGHMTASLTPVGEDSFEIMVFRSMAATAVHEIERAMKDVAARRG